MPAYRLPIINTMYIPAHNLELMNNKYLHYTLWFIKLQYRPNRCDLVLNRLCWNNDVCQTKSQTPPETEINAVGSNAISAAHDCGVNNKWNHNRLSTKPLCQNKSAPAWNVMQYVCTSGNSPTQIHQGQVWCGYYLWILTAVTTTSCALSSVHPPDMCDAMKGQEF